MSGRKQIWRGVGGALLVIGVLAAWPASGAWATNKSSNTVTNSTNTATNTTTNSATNSATSNTTEEPTLENAASAEDGWTTYVIDSDGTCGSDANDFYFSDYTVDYYLSRTTDGTSRLKTDEVLTAVFPDCDQNHGIERVIPYTNQNGFNRTLTLTSIDLKVTRNGETEPTKLTTDTSDLAYVARIGSSSTYVHGVQKYELQYEFEKVITDLDDHQELYWDTNGTGWAQKFENLTARIHFADDETRAAYQSSNRWCYVGKQGSNDQSRCQYRLLSDGTVEFTATDLAAYENLTFDLYFNAGAFVVPFEYNYAVVVMFLIVLSLFIIVAILLAIYVSKRAAKRKYYQGLLKPVQYLPPKDLSVAEAQKLYFKRKNGTVVATIMELAVQHKIELIRGEKKMFGGYCWSIKVKSLEGVTETQKRVLKMIGDTLDVEEGKTYYVMNRGYSAVIASETKLFDLETLAALKEQGLTEHERKMAPARKDHAGGNLLSTIVLIVCFLIFVPEILYVAATVFFAIIILCAGGSSVRISLDDPHIVGGVPLTISIVLMIIAAIVGIIVAMKKYRPFGYYTNAGLDMVAYLDGLREYMELAEAERMKVLQSVEGADTSTTGVVRLYERLLPYAVVFGIEESWSEELAHYYEASPELTPDWYSGATMGAFVASDFTSAMSDVSSSVSSSVASGSTSSSDGGSSGGGGGGSSGGGGGGGGGGGW